MKVVFGCPNQDALRSALFEARNFSELGGMKITIMPAQRTPPTIYAGASSKSKPVGKRVLALVAVRHEKSLPLIMAQEETQSDVKRQ